jgi:cholesterol transport system auxiliary component
MTRALALLAICVALAGLAACNVLPAQAPLPQLHDFGPPPAADADDPALPLQVAAVTAPAGLADDAIHYRLLYDDPTRYRSYAENRWASSPAELMDAGLRYTLATGPGHGSGDAYVLDTRLLEFEQDISTPHDAKVRLVLQASIRRASDGQLVAERRFEMEQASSADVQGAIGGLAQLAQKSEQAVAGWAKDQVGDAKQ